MIYLKRIKFGSTVRCFKKNTEFVFDNPMTLLVGEQGSGKSTLLAAIQMGKKLNSDISAEVEKPCKFLFFDTEKDNPRIKSDVSMGKNVMFEVCSHFRSHGETMLPILSEIDNVSDMLILIDEPETSLSVPSQYKLVSMFYHAMDRNCQIIVATHSVIFMQEFGKILNMKTKKTEWSDDYLRTSRHQAMFLKDKDKSMEA